MVASVLLWARQGDKLNPPDMIGRRLLTEENRLRLILLSRDTVAELKLELIPGEVGVAEGKLVHRDRAGGYWYVTLVPSGRAAHWVTEAEHDRLNRIDDAAGDAVRYWRAGDVRRAADAIDRLEALRRDR